MNGRLEYVRPVVAADKLDYLEELLDVQQVRTLVEAEFGAGAPSPQRLQSERRLLCVVCAGLELYPAFQWYEGRLIPGLSDVLSILTPYRAAWKILAWLGAVNRHLDGARPADLLPSNIARVLAAARLELRVRSGDSRLDSGR
jgi:hypothetical protein